MSYIGTEPKDIRSFGRTKFDYTASQGQTAFTGADDDGKVLAFTTGQIEVYVNGILMDDSDFTTTGTGTVTLASAANLNDVINIVSFESNIPDNDYVPASGGTFSGNVTHSGTVTNSGNVTVGGTLGVTGATTMSNNLTLNNASGSQITLHRTDTTIANDDLYGQIILSGDDADTNASGTRGYIRGRSQGSGGGLKMEFGTAGGGVAMGSDPRMTINADGIVTKPNQPMFDAYLTGNMTHSSGVYNMSTGDSWAIRTNVGSHFSSGTFTAPIAGKYFFAAGINLQSVGAMTYFSCEFQVNSARKYIHWFGKGGTSTSYMAANNSAIMSLAANDTVRLVSEKSHGATVVGGAAYTFFSGYLLG